MSAITTGNAHLLLDIALSEETIMHSLPTRARAASSIIGGAYNGKSLKESPTFAESVAHNALGAPAVIE